MEQLKLLFSQNLLQYQILKGTAVVEEKRLSREEDSSSDFFAQALSSLLERKYSSIQVFSGLNHFSLMPHGFDKHDLGYKLIGYNAEVEEEKEELMLALNPKNGVQFYYTFPKSLYQLIKEQNTPTSFNFSAEKFLSKITPKKEKEVHIHLLPDQCEFFVLEKKKIKLYNHLDLSSEVDFLYFMLFTLSKLGFSLRETRFYIYGETTENETFISELRKFATHLKIQYDNLPKRNFILN